MNAKFIVPAKGVLREFPTPPDADQEFNPPRYQTGDGENEVVVITAGPTEGFAVADIT
jgi:hypothetical protein